MGARGANFHYEVFARMGFEAECAKIQDLYLAGRKEEAAAAVSLPMVEKVALIGPREKIAEEFSAWEASPVTTMMVRGPADTLRAVAEIAG